MKTIHVVLCTDENYAQHAGVTIVSMVYNSKPDSPITFHIINDDLSQETRSKLQEVIAKYNAEINFIDIDSTVFDHLPVLKHISKATYYRLMIEEILPTSVEKVLYVDVDLIARVDIRKLWDICIEKYHVGAIREIGSDDKSISLRQTLGIPQKEPYFNAGVLLINLKKWREHAVGRNVLQFVNEKIKDIYFADQDGLNAILWGKWLPIHPRWNVHREALRKYYKWDRNDLSPEFIAAIKYPHIVHFAGPNKPWMGDAVPYTEEYYHYLSMTPWKGFRPPCSGLKYFIRKYKWQLRRSMVNFLDNIQSD